jgi:hypothetical protein
MAIGTIRDGDMAVVYHVHLEEEVVAHLVDSVAVVECLVVVERRVVGKQRQGKINAY